MAPEAMAGMLTEFFASHADESFNVKIVCQLLGLTESAAAREQCAVMLGDMVADDYLAEEKPGVYKLTQRNNQFIEGVFQRVSNGKSPAAR